MRFGVKKTVVPIAAASLLCLVAGPSLAAAQWAAPAPTSALTVPNAQLIQPDELNRICTREASRSRSFCRLART